jgi:hypothetical protein
MRLNLPVRPALVGAFTVLSALALAAPAPAGEGWGDVTGRVVIEGPVPEREKLKVDKDQAACLAKGPLLSEAYIVNPRNKGVQNVFVWLIDAKDPRKTPPVHPSLQNRKLPAVEIDQPCCQFVPHVVALQQGQDLVIKNGAGIAHNVHVFGGVKGPEFNVILPPGGAKRVEAADLVARPTPILVKCDIHPWMNGFVRVFAHPYFAVTDADGKFTIKNAPAGDWRVVIWQESKGWVKGDKNGSPVTIEPGKANDLGEIGLTPAKD